MAQPYAHPPSPFQMPNGTDIDVRLAAMTNEINKKANAGIAGSGYHFLGLISPDGTNWRLTVDDTGALHTEAVPRT